MNNSFTHNWAQEAQQLTNEYMQIAQEGMAFGNIDINEYNPASSEALEVSLFNTNDGY